MAPSKRGKFKNSGTQFDVSLDSSSSLQDWDDTVFDEQEGEPLQPAPDDDLLAQLPKVGLRRTLKAAGGMIQRGDFVMSMNGLEYTGDDLTLETWREMGEWLTRLRDSIQWMIGDWANLGADHMEKWLDPKQREQVLGAAQDDSDIPEGKYKWLADIVDYKYGTLRNFAYISHTFPVSRRRDTLTYSHHVEVARLESIPQQEKLLDHAENNGDRLSVRELRDLVRAEMGLLPDDIESTKPAGIYLNLMRLQQDLTPENWQKISKQERRKIHKDLKNTLAYIEEMGLD